MIQSPWMGIGYLAVISLSSFFVGRMLPYHWFSEERFPYRCYPFEHDGKIYLKVKINKWQNRLPDMSRIFSGMIPAKKLVSDEPEKLNIMISETCIAEFIHGFLCFLALGTFFFWRGRFSGVVTCLYCLGNIPFCLIQRYNRPRLIKLRDRLEEKKKEVLL